jgi:hypothetical protein
MPLSMVSRRLTVGRSFRIQRAHVAQRREAVAHVLLRIVEARKRLGRRALKRLPSEIQAVDPEMDVSVDEPGRYRAVAQIENFRSAGTADRVRHFGNSVVFDKDFRRSAYGVAQAIEQLPAHDDRLCHSELRWSTSSAADAT